MPVQLFASPVLAANIIEIFERCGTIDKTIVLGLALFGLASAVFRDAAPKVDPT
jgi:hypothetical protein